jgi:hypothetical protein
VYTGVDEVPGEVSTLSVLPLVGPAPEPRADPPPPPPQAASMAIENAIKHVFNVFITFLATFDISVTFVTFNFIVVRSVTFSGLRLIQV